VQVYLVNEIAVGLRIEKCQINLSSVNGEFI
jgi:hypothetical protein